MASYEQVRKLIRGHCQPGMLLYCCDLPCANILLLFCRKSNLGIRIINIFFLRQIPTKPLALRCVSCKVSLPKHQIYLQMFILCKILIIFIVCRYQAQRLTNQQTSFSHIGIQTRSRTL
jgi:hypothetical protein